MSHRKELPNLLHSLHEGTSFEQRNLRLRHAAGRHCNCFRDHTNDTYAKSLAACSAECLYSLTLQMQEEGSSPDFESWYAVVNRPICRRESSDTPSWIVRWRRFKFSRASEPCLLHQYPWISPSSILIQRSTVNLAYRGRMKRYTGVSPIAGADVTPQHPIVRWPEKEYISSLPDLRCHISEKVYP